MDNLDILRAFERKPDGSWLCLAPVAIATQDGTISIEPGSVFSYGKIVGHLDIAEYLEQLGASFGS